MTMDNGRSIETDVDLPEKAVYCVDCGAIFIYGRGRDCPSCHVDERLTVLKKRLDRMESDDAAD